MAYWIREFTNAKTGARFRVSSAVHYIPPLRREIAKCMSSEHFGHSVWEFKRVSGSSGLKVQAAIAC